MHTVRFVVFNLAGHILPILVALVSVPVIAHHAGVERLGALGVVWALVGYFSFLDFGLSRVVTRRVAHARDRGYLQEELAQLRGVFWQRAVPGLLVIGVVLLLARKLFAGFLPPGTLGEELARGWAWIAWCVPVTLATNWLRGALEGAHRFARVNLLRSVFGAWSYAAPAFAALYWPTLDALIVGIVLGRILSLASHAYACLQAEPGILAGASPQAPASLRSFFREGGWITISNVISPLMLYSDRFVLGAMLPPRAVAWYVTGQEVMLRTLVIPGALAGVLFPQFAGGPGADSERVLAALYRRGIRVVSALMLPLCALAAAVAYDGLRLWLGESFAANGHRIVEIVAMGIFANAISHLPHAWLQATGRADITAKVQLVELPLYAGGMFVAVLQWGIVGAAALWTLRVVADCIVLLYFAGRESAQPVFGALFAGIGLIAATGMLSGLGSGWQWRAASLLACVGVAALWAWRGLLAEEDRKELLSIRQGRRI
jgi:O-antigen/teichoic acid export membrane protein